MTGETNPAGGRRKIADLANAPVTARSDREERQDYARLSTHHWLSATFTRTERKCRGTLLRVRAGADERVLAGLGLPRLSQCFEWTAVALRTSPGSHLSRD